jgi:hypothetical protein
LKESHVRAFHGPQQKGDGEFTMSDGKARDIIDKKRTLQELEQTEWQEPEFKSHLVTTCHLLRKKPLEQFSVEDLRIMIGQGIGLPFLVPLATDVLEANPMAEGDFYAGDLLNAVVSVKPIFWSNHPELHRRINSVLRAIERLLSSLSEIERRDAESILNAARVNFQLGP